MMKINGKEFNDKKEFVREYGRGCVTKAPSLRKILIVEDELNRLDPTPKKWLIPINFVHITTNEEGHITNEQRNKQVQVLNKCFKACNITFTIGSVEFIESKKYQNLAPASSTEKDLKYKYGKDSEKYLNFYTTTLKSGLLGWATFPFDRKRRKKMDGVVMWSETLPYGKGTPYNLGMTGAHEVGHWLGLYHTFQGGCNGIGDDISDTVAHAKPNYGKPEPKRYHACREDEIDPIYNIMNYVDDEWMKELTPEQCDRVRKNLLVYRNSFQTF